MNKKTIILEYKNRGIWSYMVFLRGKKKYMVIYHPKGVSIVSLSSKRKR